MLTTETFDEEFGVTYPAWTVCTDKELQISSDNVINDKITRTMSNNAQEVIIPFAGTAEINSLMHLTTRKMLKDGTVNLLMDDYDKIKNICWNEQFKNIPVLQGRDLKTNKMVRMHSYLGYNNYDHADRNELNNRNV